MMPNSVDFSFLQYFFCLFFFFCFFFAFFFFFFFFFLVFFVDLLNEDMLVHRTQERSCPVGERTCS